MKRYTYTRLPQGYTEQPPKIFSQAMPSNLSKLTPSRVSQLLLYVDDILITCTTAEQCKEDTNAMLKHLDDQGHKTKLQLWEMQVHYLGHDLTQEERKKCYLTSPETEN